MNDEDQAAKLSEFNAELDVVARLRDGKRYKPNHWMVMIEAADEIERLRATLEGMPAGFVLVPKIVTKEMINAMCGAITGGSLYQEIWDEAIKASNAELRGGPLLARPA